MYIPGMSSLANLSFARDSFIPAFRLASDVYPSLMECFYMRGEDDSALANCCGFFQDEEESCSGCTAFLRIKKTRTLNPDAFSIVTDVKHAALVPWIEAWDRFDRRVRNWNCSARGNWKNQS
jgi:hypothetical protein